MKKLELSIPIHKLTFLQAYPKSNIHVRKSNVKKNFNSSEWYLKENYTDEKAKLITDYFRSKGLQCDCEIINKLDLKEISKGIVKSHNRN